MAKQLRDILKQASDTIKGIRPSTTSALSLGKDPGVDYDPKAGDEREFVAAHSVQKWDDPAGNPNFSKDIKHVLDRSTEDKHGHKNEEAKKKSVLPVKEEVDLKKAKGAQCNHTQEGTACPVHGMKECVNESVSPEAMAKAKQVTQKQTDDRVVGQAKMGIQNLKEKGIKEALGSMANIKAASKKGYEDSRKGQPPLQDTKKTFPNVKHFTKAGHPDWEKHGIKNIPTVKEETIEEDVSKLSDARLKFHALKGVPHGSFSNKEIKAEHQRRKSTGGAEYAAVKPALKEESDLEENKLYHVSWGPGAEHQVVAKHGDEAVSKAKSAILKKVPKLGDEKYADTWKKSPRVTNLTHERKAQKEEVEQVDEVITKKTSAGEVISDFIHSKNPKFAGKSKEERKRMALGAYYAKHPEKSKKVNEDLAVPLLGSNERDDESAEMAKAQLKAIANKAMHLITQIPDSMIVEPWVQSKINIAKDYVNTVHDYMVYGDHDKDKENKKEDIPDTAGGSAGGSMVVNQMDTPMTFPNMSVDVNTGHNV